MDGFEILREKWTRAWQIHMQCGRGIFAAPDFDANMEAVRTIGPAFADMLECAHALGLLWLIDIFKARFGPDKVQGTVDEGVETFAWFYLKNPRLFTERMLHFYKAIFEAIDLNGDGVISIDEYRVCSYLSRLSEEQVVRVFALLDADGDGVISKEEFLESYRKFICDPTVRNEDLPLHG